MGCLDRQATQHEHVLKGFDKIDMARLDALAAEMTAEVLGVTPAEALRMGRPQPLARDALDRLGAGTDEVVGSTFFPVTHARGDKD